MSSGGRSGHPGDGYPARKEAHGTLLICHGYKGFKNWGFFPYAAERLAENVDVVAFNFSHNGVGEDLLEFTELDKFARNTYSREQEDVAFLVTAIKQKKFLGLEDNSRKPLFLLGHSRGAGTALIYAFDNPGKLTGVVSWNGIVKVDLFSEEEKKKMREEGRAYTINGRTKQAMPLDAEILEDMERNRERFDILNRAGHSSVPIALVQGTEDFERLRRGSEELRAVRPDIPLYPVKGGGHTFNTVHPFQGTTEELEQALGYTLSWIEERLAQQ
ncbi:lysophospholipase [Paenibacillus sp. CC-CFT747]|nr:lysophospholipase [Paenibacillus sp. CC-CFT747]